MYNVKLVHTEGQEKFESELLPSEIIELVQERYGELLIDLQIIPIKEKLKNLTE